MKNSAFFLLLFFIPLTSVEQTTSNSLFPEAEIIYLLNDRLTNVIMQDGFTPPVAARIYAYCNVAAYESVRHCNGEYFSMTNQLNGLKEIPSVPKDESIDCGVVLVCAFTDVANSIVYRDSILLHLKDSLIQIFSSLQRNEKVILNSLDYAGKLGKAIIDWSAKDGYSQTRKMAIYTPLKKPGAWEPTPPKYSDAIEPYWGTLRTFVLDSAGQFALPFTTPYDTTSSSLFYQMVKEQYDSSTHLDSVKKMIARFWDDNPLIILSKGHTMVNYRQISPGGHWISITKIVSRQKNLSLQQACDVYMRVSLSLADAFIACWKTKYTASLLRPITYINRYIDALWKPLIETPPFPEYTCGHSTISAAASQALADYFGDSVEFIDDTNDPYGLPVRKFYSFLSASEEAGNSRIYGGIHFYPSCRAGRGQGLQIAKYISKRIITSRGSK